MDMPETVPASEFTRNFGRYRMLAQPEVVAVSSHSRIIGYSVGPDEYAEFKRFRESRRSFATAERPGEKLEATCTSMRGTLISTSYSIPSSGSLCRSATPSRASGESCLM